MMLRRIIRLLSSLFAKKSEILGEIGDKRFIKPVYFNDKRFGKTTYNPIAMRIVVDDHVDSEITVGELVKKYIYPDGEGFEFNVCFSCAAHSFFSGAKYCDPRSIWFNVFSGYYEIVVPKSTWESPFGYNIDGSVKDEACPKIAVADWNFFSNYMYGVPIDEVEKYVNETCAIIKHDKRHKIGDKYYDYFDLEDLKVVSAYVAKDGKQLINNDSIFSPLWRLSFGASKHRKGFTESFFPVNMRIRVLMSWREEYDKNYDEICYKTSIFGATINLDYPKLSGSSKSEEVLKKENEDFLNVQVKHVEELIKNSYSSLGFENDNEAQ